MREQKRKEINGITYLVTQMDGVRALKTQTKLISILGSNIFTILGGGLEGDAIMSKLAPILDGIDDKKVNEFILSLFDSGVMTETMVDGQPIPKSVDFETHFTGRIVDMWQVVGFILEANFATGN